MSPMVIFIMLTLMIHGLHAEAKSSESPMEKGLLAFAQLCLVIPWLVAGLIWSLQ